MVVSRIWIHSTKKDATQTDMTYTTKSPSNSGKSGLNPRGTTAKHMQRRASIIKLSQGMMATDAVNLSSIHAFFDDDALQATFDERGSFQF